MPYCFTIDGQTLEDQTVTVRERDTLRQERINIDQVTAYLAQRIGGGGRFADRVPYRESRRAL